MLWLREKYKHTKNNMILHSLSVLVAVATISETQPISN